MLFKLGTIGTFSNGTVDVIKVFQSIVRSNLMAWFAKDVLDGLPNRFIGVAVVFVRLTLLQQRFAGPGSEPCGIQVGLQFFEQKPLEMVVSCLTKFCLNTVDAAAGLLVIVSHGTHFWGWNRSKC